MWRLGENLHYSSGCNGYFEYFLKIRRKRLNICADLCYTYNVVCSASEEYILAVSGNNIVNNTP